MGRGEGSRSEATPQRRTRSLFGSQPIEMLLGSHTRSLKDKRFEADKDKWQREEAAFISNVVGDLEKAAQGFAASDEGWRRYLKIWSQTPHYSASNNLWARAQLRARGKDGEGLILSETHWRALGRRVKAEFARPEARRDKKYDYDRQRAWSDEWAAEMMQPLGLINVSRTVKDANGNPVLDADGKPKKESFKVWKDGEPRYKSFLVYHEQATEDIEGGEAKPLPAPPWKDAAGSQEDAKRLLDGLERHVLPRQKLELEYRSEGSEGVPAARLEGSRVIVDRARPLTEQAVAVLGVACEQAGDARRGKSEGVESMVARHKAASESTKHLIASLYGLDARDQTFPHLAEIAQSKGGLKGLQSDIQRRLNRVLHHLDPRMRVLMASQDKARAEHSRPKKDKPRAKARLL